MEHMTSFFGKYTIYRTLDNEPEGDQKFLRNDGVLIIIHDMICKQPMENNKKRQK